jgi:hypothetical protein
MVSMKKSAPTKDKKDKKPGVLARFGIGRREWQSENIVPAQDITQRDVSLWGTSATTAAALLSSGKRQARARQAIYEKWAQMEGDPIVATALSLLCTAALGGDSAKGQMVFLEPSGKAREDDRLAQVCEEISESLTDELNRVAFTLAYTGAAFGDAYARVYAEQGTGVVAVMTDEMLRPPLVQPFERGGRNVGYAVFLGETNFERLTVAQIARLKMPRTQWVPQFGVIEKALRLHILEDDMDALPVLPSMAGGSLLFNAEEPYDRLMAALVGLVGQRVLDSIDESILTVNLESMTQDQQRRYVNSVIQMLSVSKSRAEEAVKSGTPLLERIRHIVPIFNEKQMMQVTGPATNGRQSALTVEDVIFHARLLAGALGVDLSMIGFADQMAGGLGEGGFFRTSAHVAERARLIRTALDDCFNHIIDLHTLNKYGVVFSPQERPWNVNFYGSISALENEKQQSQMTAMGAASMMVQALQQMKDMGGDEDVLRAFLSQQLLIDEDLAELYAKTLAKKQDEDQDGMMGGAHDMHE